MSRTTDGSSSSEAVGHLGGLRSLSEAKEAALARSLGSLHVNITYGRDRGTLSAHCQATGW